MARDYHTVSEHLPHIGMRKIKSVLAASHANDGRYLYAVLRSVQTIAGVFIAWLINVKLFPYPGKSQEQVQTEKDS